MANITILVGKALICFAGQCHPALLGPDTPIGSYDVRQRHVIAPGYGGVVLQFKETENAVYAIHRPYGLDKKIDRRKALQSQDPTYRRSISKGCVNVSDDVFDQLQRGHYRVLEIKP